MRTVYPRIVLIIFFSLISIKLRPASIIREKSEEGWAKKRVELLANKIKGINTLTQAMISAPNTTFVIKGDFVLNSDISIPANCSLVFDGGSIISKKGYTITGNNTVLCAAPIKIFENVSFSGSYTAECAYAEWFFDYNDSIDSSPYFTKAIELANCGINKIKPLLSTKSCGRLL